jgi:Rhodanese-like domain
MQRKQKTLVAGVLALFLIAVLVVALVGLLNQPGGAKKNTEVEQKNTSVPQSVYPAPRTELIQQAVNQQNVYPPPATVALIATNTPAAIKVAFTPTTGKNALSIDNVQRTSLGDAKKAFDGNEAVFLDVRTLDAYTRNHIPGAISIPETQVTARMNELDPNQWIITYCS